VEAERLGDAAPSEEEILRVLAYGGIAWVADDDGWREVRKPIPAEAGEWTHAFHGPDRVPLATDRLLQPVTGLRWQSGIDRNHPRIGLRVAGGRVFSINSIAHMDNIYSFRRDDPTLWLVARDAANGVVLWRQSLRIDDLPSKSHDYYSSSHHFVATADSVYTYTRIGGPLTAFDAATGRVQRRYMAGARLAHESRESKLFFQKFATMFVLLRDGKIVQTMGNQLFCFDEQSGKVIYQRDDIENDLTYVAWVGDKIVAIERGRTPTAIAFEAATGKTLWRTPIKGAAYYQMFADEDVMLVAYHEGGHPIKATWYAASLDMKTGQLLWNRKTQNQYRGHVFPADGKAWFFDAVHNHYILDPRTGQDIAQFNYQAVGGGCGVEILTPDWIVRGTFLVPRDRPDVAYALNATRPVCEVPMYPAYGSLFSTGTNCGCDWYLRGSTFGFHQAQRVSPVADGQRHIEPDSAPVLSELPVRRPTFGQVTDDWTWTADPIEGTKWGRWMVMDEDDATKKLGINRDLQGAFGENNERYQWYLLESTPEVVIGDLTLVADVPGQKLVARRNGNVVWTFLAGARITVAPRVINQLALIGCNDGWIYALNVEDGTIAWQHLAAPEPKMMVAYGAVESVWPVFGVLIHEGTAYFQAGRSTAVDEGLWAGALEPATGKVKWTGRSVAYPAKLDADQMHASGYKAFQSRSLGLNTPLVFHRGKIRYLHTHHAWDPDNPEDFINDKNRWIQAASK
jgi:outer membrane protein assembly factor BamB